MSHVPMNVVLLGGSYRYPYGLGVDPTTGKLSTGDIGDRRASDLQKLYNYYRNECGYDPNTAVRMAQENYDKDEKARTTSSTSASTSKSWLEENGMEIIRQANSLAEALVTGQRAGIPADKMTQLYQQMEEEKKGEGFDFEKNMPILMIGGVALVAVLFMVGTKGKRS